MERGKGVLGESGNDGVQENIDGKERYYAHFLNGELSKVRNDQKLILNIKSTGNGWLHKSVVTVLNRMVSMMTLQVTFSMHTDKVAQFRSLGGRLVFITFQNEEVRNMM